MPRSREEPFYCGAVHVHGSNRKIVLRDDTSIANSSTSPVPKACIGYDATIVIDDDPEDPFATGTSRTSYKTDGTGTIIECSEIPDHPTRTASSDGTPSSGYLTGFESSRRQ